MITVNLNSRTYTPKRYFFGTDTFTYAVADGVASSNVATVQLTVSKIEIAPTAVNSVVTGTANTPLVLPWSNFAVNDVNGDPVSIDISALPAAGQLQSLQAGGSWAAVAVGSTFNQAAINASDGKNNIYSPLGDEYQCWPNNW